MAFDTSARSLKEGSFEVHRALPILAGDAGYGNEASILGVPDVPTWLLRHDGKLLAVHSSWRLTLATNI